MMGGKNEQSSKLQESSCHLIICSEDIIFLKKKVNKGIECSCLHFSIHAEKHHWIDNINIIENKTYKDK